MPTDSPLRKRPRQGDPLVISLLKSELARSKAETASLKRDVTQLQVQLLDREAKIAEVTQVTPWLAVLVHNVTSDDADDDDDDDDDDVEESDDDENDSTYRPIDIVIALKRTFGKFQP